MAICKILHMKDCTTAVHSRHLKRTIDYIKNGEKTQEQIKVGAVNCQPDNAYEKMIETKKYFDKLDGRQGYHIIISFKEGETDADTAYEITEQFVNEYLKDNYETVFAVHDNTVHIHAHIVFNSISFVTGLKYHYKKNDWANEIQPIVNRICMEHGLSTVEIDKDEPHDRYKEWNDVRDGAFVWSDMIKRDLDIAIAEADSYENFINILQERGYEIKQNKYLAVKPRGMTRFRRCKTLGDDYSEEAIRARIPKENLSNYKGETLEEAERIIYSRIPRGKRARLTPIQKKYYTRLYRLGLIARRPYSKAWMYKDDIKKMHALQKKYLFLVEHDIESLEQLREVKDSILSERDSLSEERKRLNATKRKCKSLFQKVSVMERLYAAKQAYQNGDKYFEEEHIRWVELSKEVAKEGYSYDEVLRLREHYDNEIKRYQDVIKDASDKVHIAEAIIRDLEEDDIGRKQEIEDKELEKQPKVR